MFPIMAPNSCLSTNLKYSLYQLKLSTLLFHGFLDTVDFLVDKFYNHDVITADDNVGMREPLRSTELITHEGI
jgi:hypothetical protein